MNKKKFDEDFILLIAGYCLGAMAFACIGLFFYINHKQ